MPECMSFVVATTRLLFCGRSWPEHSWLLIVYLETIFALPFSWGFFENEKVSFGDRPLSLVAILGSIFSGQSLACQG
jgi:hypothetical protein